jgi:hypothetical protein
MLVIAATLEIELGGSQPKARSDKNTNTLSKNNKLKSKKGQIVEN